MDMPRSSLSQYRTVSTAGVILFDATVNQSMPVLLLFRLHALWGGRRSVVLGTFALFFLTYAAVTVVATFSILELTR